jgi:hypothetical protein
LLEAAHGGCCESSGTGYPINEWDQRTVPPRRQVSSDNCDIRGKTTCHCNAAGCHCDPPQGLFNIHGVTCLPSDDHRFPARRDQNLSAELGRGRSGEEFLHQRLKQRDVPLYRRVAPERVDRLFAHDRD